MGGPGPSTETIRAGHAAQAEIAAARRVAFIEDVEYLMSVREHPERICKRLGYKNSETIKQQLRRVGRYDLISYFNLEPEREDRWWEGVVRKRKSRAALNG